MCGCVCAVFLVQHFTPWIRCLMWRKMMVRRTTMRWDFVHLLPIHTLCIVPPPLYVACVLWSVSPLADRGGLPLAWSEGCPVETFSSTQPVSFHRRCEDELPVNGDQWACVSCIVCLLVCEWMVGGCNRYGWWIVGSFDRYGWWIVGSFDRYGWWIVGSFDRYGWWIVGSFDRYGWWIVGSFDRYGWWIVGSFDRYGWWIVGSFDRYGRWMVHGYDSYGGGWYGKWMVSDRRMVSGFDRYGKWYDRYVRWLVWGYDMVAGGW